jgi:hypothetical protein
MKHRDPAPITHPISSAKGESFRDAAGGPGRSRATRLVDGAAGRHGRARTWEGEP